MIDVRARVAVPVAVVHSRWYKVIRFASTAPSERLFVCSQFARGRAATHANECSCRRWGSHAQARISCQDRDAELQGVQRLQLSREFPEVPDKTPDTLLLSRPLTQLKAWPVMGEERPSYRRLRAMAYI